jgi:hypothetical protein
LCVIIIAILYDGNNWKDRAIDPTKTICAIIASISSLTKEYTADGYFGYLSKSAHLFFTELFSNFRDSVRDGIQRHKERKAEESERRAEESKGRAEESERRAEEMPFNVKTIIAKLQVSENSRTPPKAPSRDPE